MATVALAVLGFLGTQELLIILVIVLVLFGASRIPQLMRGIGLGVREFRDAVKSEPEREKPTRPEDSPSDKDEKP